MTATNNPISSQRNCPVRAILNPFGDISPPLSPEPPYPPPLPPLLLCGAANPILSALVIRCCWPPAGPSGVTAGTAAAFPPPLVARPSPAAAAAPRRAGPAGGAPRPWC